MTFDEAVAYSLTLPDTTRGTYYGGPAVIVARNGRAFLSPGREADAFCLSIARDHIPLLIDTDPETFFQTPHYVGWDAVLVRHASRDEARVRQTIALARDQAAAKKPARRRG